MDREQRLDACRETLKEPSNRQTVAAVAYHWGFGDQAQFSRAFKMRFGVSPKDYRDQAAKAARSGLYDRR
jgi:AraC-like DNA-binding protein